MKIAKKAVVSKGDYDYDYDDGSTAAKRHSREVEEVSVRCSHCVLAVAVAPVFAAAAAVPVPDHAAPVAAEDTVSADPNSNDHSH